MEADDASDAELADYDGAACGLLVTRSDGTIRRVNGTLCAWLDYAADELIGKRFQDLLTVGSKLFHHTHWMPLLQIQGSVAEVQLEIVHRSGRVLPVLVNASRRGAASGTPRAPEAERSAPIDVAVFVAADRRKYERELLLARRRAEELLASEREAQQARALAEAQLRLALESAHLRVWTAQLPSGIRSYGAGVAALIGRPEGETVTGEMIAACMHPEDRELDAAAFAAAIDPERRATYAVEQRLLGYDGLERIVRSTGRASFDEENRAVHFSGVLEDVTERRRAEEALRQRETEFRTLAENSPDIIARFDRQRRCMFMSAAVERLTSVAPERFVGKQLAELPVASKWMPAVDEAFAGQPVTLDFTYDAHDGPRELQAQLVPERNARGEVVSVLALTRDVSLLREQERAANDRADLAELLIGIVSHDLRNPLQAVMLGAMVLEAVSLGEHASTVRRIAASADRANRLITDLLDFTQARLAGGLRVDRRELDLHQHVAECLEEVKVAWPGREIRHARHGFGLGSFDPDRVAQVVSNLLNNALAYGAPEQPITVTTLVEGKLLGLRVHNFGAAIPDELKPHIFEPLRRGENEQRPGSRSVGLGLYIVREIAAAHGGHVTVQSGAGEGTTFLVSWPRPAVAQAGSATRAPSSPRPGSKPRDDSRYP